MTSHPQAFDAQATSNSSGMYGAPMMPPPMGAESYRQSTGAPGKIRSTGMCIFLCVITLGVYSIVWFYQVHSEMKRHTGSGLGGELALVISIIFGIVMPYITSKEVGELYVNRGRVAPVGVTTGLWYFPGIFILIGPLVWFMKTNEAINEYWESVGAVAGR